MKEKKYGSVSKSNPNDKFAGRDIRNFLGTSWDDLARLPDTPQSLYLIWERGLRRLSGSSIMVSLTAKDKAQAKQIQRLLHWTNKDVVTLLRNWVDTQAQFKELTGVYSVMGIPTTGYILQHKLAAAIIVANAKEDSCTQVQSPDLPEDLPPVIRLWLEKYEGYGYVDWVLTIPADGAAMWDAWENRPPMDEMKEKYNKYAKGY